MGVGLHRGRAELRGAGADPVVVDVDAGAHAVQRVDGGHEAVLVAAADAHLPAGHQAGREVAEGLEAVALQASLGPVERLDAFDDEAAVGAQRDVGAHALQEQRQLDHLGLGRGVVDHRAALGQHGRQHHRLGGADRRVGERDAGAAAGDPSSGP